MPGGPVFIRPSPGQVCASTPPAARPKSRSVRARRRTVMSARRRRMDHRRRRCDRALRSEHASACASSRDTGYANLNTLTSTSGPSGYRQADNMVVSTRQAAGEGAESAAAVRTASHPRRKARSFTRRSPAITLRRSTPTPARRPSSSHRPRGKAHDACGLIRGGSG